MYKNKFKVRRKKNTVLLGLILITITLFTLNIGLHQQRLFPSDNNKLTYQTFDILKTSATYNGITVDDTRTTNGTNWGNWTWARTQPWCTGGNGTQGNPYIIEDSTFLSLGPSDCLIIQHSRKFFVIRNCTSKDTGIVNPFAGIKLINVTNGRVIDNQVYNNYYGILCNNVNISQLIGNNCSNNRYGIDFIQCNDNKLTENTVNGNNEAGISLEESTNNTISGNTANGNYDGIYLWNYCYNNTISGNTANDNGRAGIYLTDSDYNNITENTASGNIDGIFLEDENNNNIITGNIFNNNAYGIEIYLSDFNSIIGNTANDNNNYGIRIEGSNNNTISGNNANNNTHYGMFIQTQSDNNAVSGNSVNDNEDTGIHIDDDCDYNDITENIVYNNSLGIYLYSDCGNNSIYKNFFLKNGKHADDDGIDNKWNSTTIGNYWDNHTTPDANEDGIIDDPYTYIGGSTGSIDYLPIAEPSILINSPSPGDVFGTVAPSFDVTIIYVHIVTKWYTIDGGLHNYTFTENDMINQSAWDALPEGSVTITFYAKDIVGNEASEEVIVIKSISADGLDPGVIAVIVIVSVVGGIAIIGAVYIFLKKRKAPA